MITYTDNEAWNIAVNIITLAGVLCFVLIGLISAWYRWKQKKTPQ